LVICEGPLDAVGIVAKPIVLFSDRFVGGVVLYVFEDSSAEGL